MDGEHSVEALAVHGADEPLGQEEAGTAGRWMAHSPTGLAVTPVTYTLPVSISTTENTSSRPGSTASRWNRSVVGMVRDPKEAKRTVRYLTGEPDTSTTAASDSRRHDPTLLAPPSLTTLPFRLSVGTPPPRFRRLLGDTPFPDLLPSELHRPTRVESSPCTP